MKTEIKYKGAYLSEPINGKRMWILLMSANGFQEDRLFGDLKFKAQRAAVEQGFTKQSLIK
jgi:hypothetical protein